MNKLVQIAEQYVEWVALALGGLFLLLMMFLYLLSTPVSKELGGKKVTLSDVDRVIYDDQARLLDEAMNGNVDVPVTVKPYAVQFKDVLAMKNVEAVKIADDRQWIGVGAVPSETKGRTKGETPIVPGVQVKELPEPLPAADWHAAATGRSLIPLPVAPGVAGAVPAAVVPPVAGVAGQVTQPGIDKLWVTEAFSIPTQKIADAFSAAHIPANLPTAFLAIELIREEQLPGGEWGNATLIKPLAMHQVMSFPTEGNVSDEANYLDWATRNTTTLILPSFNVVVAGDKWYAPGQPNPNGPAPVDTTVRPVSPPVAAPRPPVRAPRPPRGVHAPDDARPAAFDMYAQAPSYTPPPWAATGQPVGPPPGAIMPGTLPPGATPPGYGGTPPGYGGMPPGSMDPSMMPGQGVAVPISAVPEGFTVPSGNFVPSDLKKNVFVWAHDDTVEADKVYRYKLRYRLKNPVYRSNAVADPKLARQFSLASADSDWSDPVVIPPSVYVFLASGVTANTTSAKFDVLQWQNGKWSKKSFTAEPGDIIGGTVKDSDIDYTTGYSLVDMKLDVVTRDPKVVLCSRTGELTTRSLRADQSEIITRQKEVGYVDPTAVPKTGTPGAPGTPGWAPPGMPPGMSPGGMPMGPPPGWTPPPGGVAPR